MDENIITEIDIGEDTVAFFSDLGNLYLCMSFDSQ